jgi:hypothetical protein
MPIKSRRSTQRSIRMRLAIGDGQTELYQDIVCRFYRGQNDEEAESEEHFIAGHLGMKTSKTRHEVGLATLMERGSCRPLATRRHVMSEAGGVVSPRLQCGPRCTCVSNDKTRYLEAEAGCYFRHNSTHVETLRPAPW